MRALVVYESMFGNTEQVARQVADGLSGHAQVELREVSEAPAQPDELLDLVVLGGPTHAFSMSRASTREDARRQGATHGEVYTGLREWLRGLGVDAAAWAGAAGGAGALVVSRVNSGNSHLHREIPRGK